MFNEVVKYMKTNNQKKVIDDEIKLINIIYRQHCNIKISLRIYNYLQLNYIYFYAIILCTFISHILIILLAFSKVILFNMIHSIFFTKFSQSIETLP